MGGIGRARFVVVCAVALLGCGGGSIAPSGFDPTAVASTFAPTAPAGTSPASTVAPPSVAPTEPVTCAEAPSDLVAWWPADGDATDPVGHNDGTMEGGATFAEGKVGQAFKLDLALCERRPAFHRPVVVADRIGCVAEIGRAHV